MPARSSTPSSLVRVRPCRIGGKGFPVFLAMGFVGLLGSPSPAFSAGAGGVSVNPPAEQQAAEIVVRKISCLKGCSSIDSAVAGATLRFQGPRLTMGKRVVYLGAAGPADDVLAQLRIVKSGRARIVTATLPKRAHTGPVAIEIKPGARSSASAAKVVLPEPVAAVAPLPGNGPFFPVRGDYKFGSGSATFGGGRGHQGHDVFAKCGTPLVAAEGGKVLYKEFHSRAGNYVVIDVAGADRDEAYMHLRAPALVNKGDDVVAGQQLGEVGDTGRADGCHLHFELWNGTWQRMGGNPGTPIDPLPTLKLWAAGPSAAPAAAR